MIKELYEVTEDMSASEVFKKYRYLLYSKHNDVYSNLLDSEVLLLEKALKKFTIQLGNIQGENKVWNAICVGLSHYYIAFREVGSEGWVKYYELNELDKRYIDYRIDMFLGDV